MWVKATFEALKKGARVRVLTNQKVKGRYPIREEFYIAKGSEGVVDQILPSPPWREGEVAVDFYRENGDGLDCVGAYDMRDLEVWASDKELIPWVAGFTICVDVFDVEWQVGYSNDEVCDLVIANLPDKTVHLRSVGGPNGPLVNGVLNFDFEIDGLYRNEIDQLPYKVMLAMNAVKAAKAALEKNNEPLYEEDEE